MSDDGYDVAEYANEAGVPCECGDPDFVSGDVEDSGVQPGTHHGPAVHWFYAVARCRCGRDVQVSDSS